MCRTINFFSIGLIIDFTANEWPIGDFRLTVQKKTSSKQHMALLILAVDGEVCYSGPKSLLSACESAPALDFSLKNSIFGPHTCSTLKLIRETRAVVFVSVDAWTDLEEFGQL